MSYEGASLDEAFPSFCPPKRRSKRERRKRAEQYYMNVANERLFSDSDTDSDEYPYTNPVNPKFFQKERNQQRGQMSRQQDLDMKRMRETGVSPNPNAMQVPRYGEPPLVQQQQNHHQPPSHEQVAGASHDSNQNFAQAKGVTNYPPDAAQVDYSHLTPGQKHRLSTVNQGYTLQTDQGVRRNLVMPGMASGAKGSSAMGVAFQNMSSTLQETNPTTYAGSEMPTIRSNTGYMNANQGFRPEETSSLYDYKNDTIYPFNGYTDYATTYRNPYTGEVTETYTIDLKRYATDVWKEVPTIELGKANPKLEAFAGMGRLARPLPKKTENPNEEIMPSFDPTYGFAAAESSRQDTSQRVQREMLFQQDPGFMPAMDQGNWTGYVGLHEMARYVGDPTPTLRSGGGSVQDLATTMRNNEVVAGGMGNNTQFSVGDSGMDVASRTVGSVAPTFYAKTNPNMFVDAYQPAQSSADPGRMAQADDTGLGDEDIPMIGMGPETDISLQVERAPGVPITDSSIPNVMRTPTTNVNELLPQATEFSGGRDITLDILGLPTTNINIGVERAEARLPNNPSQTNVIHGPTTTVNELLPQATEFAGGRGVTPNTGNQISTIADLSTLFNQAEGTPVVDSAIANTPHVAETAVNIGIERVPDQVSVGEVAMNTSRPIDTGISLTTQQVDETPVQAGEMASSRNAPTTTVSLKVAQSEGLPVTDSSVVNEPRTGLAPIPSGLRMEQADTHIPRDDATGGPNIMRRESDIVVNQSDLTTPGRPLIDTLNDGSFTNMERQDANAYLQNNWQTDTQRARQGLMAKPRVETITVTNPIVQESLALTAESAGGYFPTMSERHLRGRSNAKLNNAFATSVPLKSYESNTENEC